MNCPAGFVVATRPPAAGRRPTTAVVQDGPRARVIV